MRERPDFKKTQEISIDLADQIAAMSSVSQINLALNVIIPMNPENESHRGAPTVMRDGKIYIDTSVLKKKFAEALNAHDPLQVPDVLNLQQAVKNVLKKRHIALHKSRHQDTIPTVDPKDTPNDQETKKRNPNLAKTIPYTPPKKD